MSPKNKRISRHGSYGVVWKDSKMLFTLKKSGPFKGLWGLPGGAIEFGETPEEALKRELLEEAALAAGQLELLTIATFTGEYHKDGECYDFHHIGIVYRVVEITSVPNLVPEEEARWSALGDIKYEELTPFAKHVADRK